jgi:hypothetical protein
MTKPINPQLRQFLNDGKHLPDFLKDFHDQKDIFKFLHSYFNKPSGIGFNMPTWVDGQIYTIDHFLFFMGAMGYTLQKSRSKQVDFPSFEDFKKDLNKL